MQLCPNGNPFICMPGFNPRDCTQKPADDIYVRLRLYYPWSFNSLVRANAGDCEWEYEINVGNAATPWSWDASKFTALRGVHLPPMVNGPFEWPYNHTAWAWQGQDVHELRTSLGNRQFRAKVESAMAGHDILVGIKRVARTDGGNDLVISGAVGYYKLPEWFGPETAAGAVRNVLIHEGTYNTCCPWLPGSHPVDFVYPLLDIWKWQHLAVCDEPPLEQYPPPAPPWEQYSFSQRRNWAIAQAFATGVQLQIVGRVYNHNPTDFELDALYSRTQSLFQLIRNNPGSYLRVSHFVPDAPIATTAAGMWYDSLHPGTPHDLPAGTDWTPTADDADYVLLRTFTRQQYLRLAGWTNIVGNNFFCQNAYGGPPGPGPGLPDPYGDPNGTYTWTDTQDCSMQHMEPLAP